MGYLSEEGVRRCRASAGNNSIGRTKRQHVKGYIAAHSQCWCVNSSEVGECYYYYYLERTLDFIKLPQQLPGMMIWLPTSKVSGDIYSVKSVMALS